MTFGLSDVGWSQLYFTQSRWQQHDITTSYDEDQACLMVNWLLIFTAYTWKNTSFHITMIYILQLQHKKSGYKSPVTALYLPFSLKLWMAVISAIFLSLCFTITYANTHPDPELSVYNLAILTFASIFEEAHVASMSLLHSNTIRYCIFSQ